MTRLVKPCVDQDRTSAARPTLGCVVPVPVVCESCGTLFVVTNLIGGSGAANVQIENSRYSPCPACGGTGRILDGLYEFAGDALRSFTATTPYSALHIQRLIRVVKRAQRGEATAQDIADSIQRDAPDLAAVAQRLLVPKTAGDFYAMLAVLLAILLYLLTHGDNTMSTEDVEKVTHDVVEQVMNEKPPMPVAPTAEPPRTKRPPPPPRKRHAQAKNRKRR